MISGTTIRLFASSLLVTLLFLYLPSCTTSDAAGGNQVQVLTGATLFDGTGGEPIENSVIVMEEGEISCVGAEGECDIPAGASREDMSGRFITPGLVDAHVHFFQTAFFDSRPDAMDLRETLPFTEVAAYQKQNPERYYDAYLCSGITGVYDVGGFTWSIDLQESAEQNPAAPHVAAAGPLITPSTLDIFNTAPDKVLVNLDSEQTGRELVQYLSNLGSTGIKLWQLRTGSEEFMNRVQAVTEEIEEFDNQLVVHATSLTQAKAAVEAGAKVLVHSVSDTTVDDEFLQMAIDQGTIYTPTLTVSSGYMLAYRAAAGIAPYPMDDPNQCVDSRTSDLLAKASQFQNHPRLSDGFKERLRGFDPDSDRVSETDLRNLKRAYDAGVTIAVGTDAGNPGTVHGPSIYAEMEAMQRAGISAADLIVMATRNGAMAMRRADDFGTLEEGKMANLIVLEEDPSADIANMRSILFTMNKGTLYNVENIDGN